MKYKEGDKVRIKSLDWYNKNKDEYGVVSCGEQNFVEGMKKFCSETLTISEDASDGFLMLEDYNGYVWTDEMIEGLVEEETKNWADVSIPEGPYTVTYDSPSKNDSMSKNIIYNEINLPTGYQFIDENGNVINATKISLRKKKEVIPNLQLDSIRTVREYDTAHSRIWLEIYEDNPELCIFTHLLVDEDHRRKGYGTKALEQAEIIAKDLGCDTIHLKVETDSWMHEWYLRAGYKFLTNAEDNYTWLTKSI